MVEMRKPQGMKNSTKKVLQIPEIFQRLPTQRRIFGVRRSERD